MCAALQQQFNDTVRLYLLKTAIYTTCEMTDIKKTISSWSTLAFWSASQIQQFTHWLQKNLVNTTESMFLFTAGINMCASQYVSMCMYV